jgi:AraC family transcriptional regulator
MEPRIVTRPAVSVVGMKYHGRNEHDEIKQLWETFIPRVGEFTRFREPKIGYGVMDHYDERSGAFDYLAAFEASGEAEPPPGWERWSIPARTYAMFASTLPALSKTFHDIYDTWLPTSGYRRAAGPEFEYYDEHFNGDDDSTVYVCIPVMKE